MAGCRDLFVPLNHHQRGVVWMDFGLPKLTIRDNATCMRIWSVSLKLARLQLSIGAAFIEI